MNATKKWIILALVGVNVMVLAGMVWTNQSAAYAQQFNETDYVIISGQISEDYDAVYVIDLARQRLAALKMDKTTKRVQAMAGVNLGSAFRADR